jgi:hypothetical protein|tara:strand:- start:76 stop:243 length:168 start_codon:yes stop_codon:yes gene_type:complete
MINEMLDEIIKRVKVAKKAIRLNKLDLVQDCFWVIECNIEDIKIGLDINEDETLS